MEKKTKSEKEATKSPVSKLKSSVREGRKKLKKSVFKKGGKEMNIYSSLSYKHRAKKEAKARKNAEDLADLPKEPVKRFFCATPSKTCSKVCL